MARPEKIFITQHISAEELHTIIKKSGKDPELLPRLYFIKYRYEGVSVEESSKRVGISKPVAYIWQERWNENGYEGLKPRYAGGRPSKLTDDQKDKLRSMLHERDDWSTEKVRELIFKEFDVEYSKKQIQVILKKFGMRYAKPLTHDYRRPENAENILKKTCLNLKKAQL